MSLGKPGLLAMLQKLNEPVKSVPLHRGTGTTWLTPGEGLEPHFNCNTMPGTHFPLKKHLAVIKSVEIHIIIVIINVSDLP